MTATYKDNLDGTATLSFVYSADKQRILDTAEAAAHYLWLRGYGPQPTASKPLLWSDVTAKDRLAILDAYVKQVLMDAAKTYHITAAMDAARLTAEADDKFIPKE